MVTEQNCSLLNHGSCASRRIATVTSPFVSGKLYASACLSPSRTMKHAELSSIDHGGGKRRGVAVRLMLPRA
jgi:hypothetical protein